jgi:UDP-N-acetylglucosamine:LPS N-acetylglucosamine transferase
VLLIASCGGHWIELTRLAGAFRDCDCEFVSTTPNLIPPIGHKAVQQVTDSSRDTILGVLDTAVEIRSIIRSRRPELVVSTGAAPGAIALAIAKFYGAQTIWIDSLANTTKLSLSGRFVRYIADLRLTQWPHLARAKSNIRYFGRVL